MAGRIFGFGGKAGAGGQALPDETGDGSNDHLHRCPDGHTWIHAGTSSVRCEHRDAAPGDAADCPFCAGRAHYHRCPTCDVEWLHEGACDRDRPICLPRLILTPPRPPGSTLRW